MPNIQVILNPVRAAIAGQQRVVGLTADLNFAGAGTTLASATQQKAELSFFEAIGPRDDQSSPSLFATLRGKVSLNGQTPVFDANGEFVRYMRPGLRTEPVKSGPGWFPPAQSTDWYLSLAFNSQHFRNVDHLSRENERLFLPWFPEAGEAGAMEIGSELTIDGKQEFFFDTQNVISVACVHSRVHRDGTAAQTAAFYGSGIVHPRDNNVHREFPASRGRINCPNVGGVHRIAVNFHQSVNSVIFDWSRVIAVMVAQFQELGLILDVQRSLTDAQARTAGFDYVNDGSNGNEKTWMASVADGASMPFFTFWVFYAHEVVSAGSADGLSEGKVAVNANGLTKNVRYPIRLLAQLRQELQSLASADQKDLHVANVISHEIGHCLGLDHVLEVQPGRGYVLTPSSADVTRAVMAWENLGPFTFTRQRRFGPVHVALIARDYFR